MLHHNIRGAVVRSSPVKTPSSKSQPLTAGTTMKAAVPSWRPHYTGMPLAAGADAYGRGRRTGLAIGTRPPCHRDAAPAEARALSSPASPSTRPSRPSSVAAPVVVVLEEKVIQTSQLIAVFAGQLARGHARPLPQRGLEPVQDGPTRVNCVNPKLGAPVRDTRPRLLRGYPLVRRGVLQL